MLRPTLPTRLLVAAPLGALALVVMTAQQTPPQPAIFTAVQAESGQAIYSRTCAGCHGAGFEGSGDAPPLAGGSFLLKWRPRMVSELFGEILQNMPPTNPGSLGEAAALNATAYILQHNGAQAGGQALTAGAATEIGAVATGSAQAAAAPVRGRAGRGAVPLVLGAGSGDGHSGSPAARGVTAPGEVKDYIPVTTEMLRKPPAGDWLIFGRNYQRHSYSPLDGITRDNVKGLQLKWAWAMNDSGANETTPIVHNGVIYLASPSNIVQAIDAKTGTLIWETRVGPDQAPGYGGIRSIAIAEDKVFLPTSDAHVVAIDARNGKIVWNTPASDKPHNSTSGAIVIGDKVLMGLTGCARFDGEGCYISAFDIHSGKRAWPLIGNVSAEVRVSPSKWTLV